MNMHDPALPGELLANSACKSATIRLESSYSWGSTLVKVL
jgi:hypothetical protein